MSALAKLNGEALFVPDLRFWSQRSDGCFGLIAQNERGAVEVWCYEDYENGGGVEVHSVLESPTSLDLYDLCTVLDGPCWSDRSLLAYGKVFLPLIKAGDSAGVLHELARWPREHFPVVKDGVS